MQTNLTDAMRATPEGREADTILRKCTHCGFCLATCPTYQLSGDERDSPRGRIYLMKQVLEGAEPTEATQIHLDRCLTCRNCETTCPSGVDYGHLLDIGRQQVEARVPRSTAERATRELLRRVLPKPRLFAALLATGRAMGPLVPERLRTKLPPKGPAPAWPQTGQHSRHVLLLEGCVQPALQPEINPITARLLDRLGIAIERTPATACCGAIDQHLGHPEAALVHVRRNIDAWWPCIDAGAEAIVVNASGCGLQVKDYGHLLRNDPDYADKARRVSELTVDPIELLLQEESRLKRASDAPERIAFHAPCTLQHGQKLGGRVEALLRRLGFRLTAIPDAHMCCGSAGTYSLLQPEWATELRNRKLDNLQSGRPELIATANIGCQTHLATGTDLPVCHWLALIDAQ